jgi:hypothetical protein
MANGHGGARPGAGRKRKETIDEQSSRRSVVMSVLSEARLRKIVERDVKAAEGGDTYRVDRWLPYVLGSPKQDISVDSDSVIRVEYADADAEA